MVCQSVDCKKENLTANTNIFYLYTTLNLKSRRLQPGAIAEAKMGRSLRLEQTGGQSAVVKNAWGPSAAARIDLGSCHLGNCMYLGSYQLGK